MTSHAFSYDVIAFVYNGHKTNAIRLKWLRHLAVSAITPWSKNNACCLSYQHYYYRLSRHKGSTKHSHIRRQIYIYRQACRVKIIKSHQNHASQRAAEKKSGMPHILSRQHHRVSTDHILNVKHCTI